MASTNFFVMSCGRVIAEPTTTLYAPTQALRFTFSGVSILPSAIKGCLIRANTVLKISKSFLQFYRPLLCLVYPTKVLPIKSKPSSSA